MRTIYHLFDGIFDWKRGCLGKRGLKRWRLELFEDEIADLLNWMEEIQECAVHIARWILSSSLGSICKKKQLFTSWNRAGNRPKFWKKSARTKHIKNWQIFWTNNNCRTMWRILQISENVIHLGFQPRLITSSSICIILHILLNLIQ